MKPAEMEGSALERLAEKIRHGRAAGILPPEWETLAESALAEVAQVWESEKAFRNRTGASDKWCREHFARCEADGLAKLKGKRRVWNVHARGSRPGKRLDPESLTQEIVDSFHRKAS